MAASWCTGMELGGETHVGDKALDISIQVIGKPWKWTVVASTA